MSLFGKKQKGKMQSATGGYELVSNGQRVKFSTSKGELIRWAKVNNKEITNPYEIEHITPMPRAGK